MPTIPTWVRVLLIAVLLCGVTYALAAEPATAVVVHDDSGHYTATIDVRNFGPLRGDINVPDGATAYAVPATITRLADGATFKTTYLVLDTQCKRGSGILVWLTANGTDLAGTQPYQAGADTWPTRVAKVLCDRVPSA